MAYIKLMQFIITMINNLSYKTQSDKMENSNYTPTEYYFNSVSTKNNTRKYS